ncbi:hypothetical protein PT136_04520 (plasmid) [Borreliella garinii]|uniref:Uncharacterized protein n=1 Tax=Borreliella garinii PBr TaxID=498743 RepID=B8F1R6_BORGR|nr:hypothetical protein [Borreliella garinii]ACL34858.1 hypothetical protein BGAPBR_D0018 [Borreliella garinii PBr]WNZ72107.1 hypothetical protein PT136_04520 [Borreliella garinii]
MDDKIEFRQFTKDILTDLDKSQKYCLSYIRIGKLPFLKISI